MLGDLENQNRDIYIKYFAYRGAVHFQEVSSGMSRRGESDTGNWLPTWKWFADYLDPLNPHHNPKHSSILDMKRAQLVSEKSCSLVAFLDVFHQVVVPRRWKGVSNFQFMKSGKFNISRNLMIWQMWRLLGGTSAHWRWHATIEKKPRFQTICMIWNAFETRSCFISLKMTKLHIILDQTFEHVEYIHVISCFAEFLQFLGQLISPFIKYFYWNAHSFFIWEVNSQFGKPLSLLYVCVLYGDGGG